MKELLQKKEDLLKSEINTTLVVGNVILVVFNGVVREFDAKTNNVDQDIREWIKFRQVLENLPEGEGLFSLDMTKPDMYDQFSEHGHIDFVVPPLGTVYVKDPNPSDPVDDIKNELMDQMQKTGQYLDHRGPGYGFDHMSRDEMERMVKQTSRNYGYDFEPKIGMYASETIPIKINGKVMNYTFPWADQGTVGYARITGGQAIGGMMTNIDYKWGEKKTPAPGEFPLLWFCGTLQWPGYNKKAGMDLQCFCDAKTPGYVKPKKLIA